jgi:hypothetical protein
VAALAGGGRAETGRWRRWSPQSRRDRSAAAERSMAGWSEADRLEPPIRSSAERRGADAVDRQSLASPSSSTRHRPDEVSLGHRMALGPDARGRSRRALKNVDSRLSMWVADRQPSRVHPAKTSRSNPAT